MSTQPTTPKSGFQGFNVPPALSWRNPQETGLLLAESLGIFVVLSSPLTLRLFLRLSFWLVGLFSLIELVSKHLNGQQQGFIAAAKPSRFLPLNHTVANQAANALSNLLRKIISGVENVLDAKNPVKGLKIAAVCRLVYSLLGIFSVKFLVLFSIVLVFGLPPLYLQFKTQVDDAITELRSQASGHAKKVGDAAYAKAGPQIDFVKKLVGNRGGFPAKANVSPVKDFDGASAKPTAFTSGASTSPAASAASATHAAPSAPVTSKSPSAAPKSTTTGETVSPSKAAGSIPVETKTTTTTHTAQVPEDVFSKFDSVPSLAGNIPIDQDKVNKFVSKNAP